MKNRGPVQALEAGDMQESVASEDRQEDGQVDIHILNCHRGHGIAQ